MTNEFHDKIAQIYWNKQRKDQTECKKSLGLCNKKIHKITQSV